MENSRKKRLAVGILEAWQCRATRGREKSIESVQAAMSILQPRVFKKCVPDLSDLFPPTHASLKEGGNILECIKSTQTATLLGRGDRWPTSVVYYSTWSFFFILFIVREMSR